MGKKKGKPAPDSGKIKYDPDKHCGARKRDGSRCLKSKGWGVKGVSDGPCRAHGGAAAKANRTHGWYSNIKSDRVKSLLKRVRKAEHDVMDLAPEAELIRAMAIDFLERYDEMQGALLLWHQTVDGTTHTLIRAVDAGDAKSVKKLLKKLDKSFNKRPAQILDITDVSVLVDKIGRTVERIHKIRSSASISHEQLGAIFNSMSAVLLLHVQDDKVKQQIFEGWKRITVE